MIDAVDVATCELEVEFGLGVADDEMALKIVGPVEAVVSNEGASKIWLRAVEDEISVAAKERVEIVVLGPPAMLVAPTLMTMSEAAELLSPVGAKDVVELADRVCWPPDDVAGSMLGRSACQLLFKMT